MNPTSRGKLTNGWKIWILSAAGAVSMLALPAAQTMAQDATPAAVSPYDPASCTTAPISTDYMSMLLATPVAQPALPTGADGVVVLPEGVPASDAELTAVKATVEQLWSCNNARNKAAVYALFTDEAIQQTIGFTDGATWDAADLRANVASELTPGEPRTQEEWATIDTIVSATTYDDGQIGVLILNSDPLVAGGDQVLDYFRFVMVDGVAKVSGVILDPYDLTPDYGFESAA